MKILVTGICGFIGSHFADMAVACGHEVYGLDSITYAGRIKNTLEKGVHYKARLGDICDANVVSDLINEFQPDAIVHFAAESHVARSIESRDEFLRTNVGGTNVLLNESLKYWRGADIPFDKSKGKKKFITPFTNDMQQKTQILPIPNFRFLHVSTDEVYGSLDKYEAAWTEQSPYAPNNPYSASKAASDHLVRSYNKTYGLPTIITHSANNYGTRQHPEKLIPLLIGQLMRGEAMTIHGNGLNIRDWIHVEDHCRGLLLALDFGKDGETYNFGGGCERTNLDIANMIARNMHVPAVINFIEDRAGNDQRYSTNISKASSCLGWHPHGFIDDRILQVIQWYLENPNYGDDYGR